jgi:hypothetical protein
MRKSVPFDKGSSQLHQSLNCSSERRRYVPPSRSINSS